MSQPRPRSQRRSWRSAAALSLIITEPFLVTSFTIRPHSSTRNTGIHHNNHHGSHFGKIRTTLTSLNVQQYDAEDIPPPPDESLHSDTPPPLVDSTNDPLFDGLPPSEDQQTWDTTAEDREYIRDEDSILTEREDRLFTNEVKIENCVLVAVEDLGRQRRQSRSGSRYNYDENDDIRDDFSLEESMSEMRELIKTCNLKLVGEVTQRMQEPNPRTYIGKGKVGETLDLAHSLNCCTVVFDAELHPGQQKALENMMNKNITLVDSFERTTQQGEIKVIDRTALILDIFAQHAKTREGKLQVELALHEYRKPRLTKLWTHLERQSGAGGVGLRGPGESQLEIDKRLLRDRIITLKSKIEDVSKQRDLHRRGRKKGGLPILSLVGYTNAGKSTLLNFLTRAGVMAENILFATLDPTTRKVKLPGYKTHPEVLITDTVGFIQKLPTQLVAAFRATLEEVREADVLIHVVDVSSPSWEKQEAAVKKVLNDIGVGDKPIVRVFNKIDLMDTEDAEYLKYEAASLDEYAVAVSAATGEGMEDFVAVVEEAMGALLMPIEVEIPFDKGDELNLIHEVGSVETIDYRPTGTYVAALVPKAVAMRLGPYSVNEMSDDDTIESEEEEIDWVAIGRGRHSAKG